MPRFDPVIVTRMPPSRGPEAGSTCRQTGRNSLNELCRHTDWSSDHYKRTRDGNLWENCRNTKMAAVLPPNSQYPPLKLLLLDVTDDSVHAVFRSQWPLKLKWYQVHSDRASKLLPGFDPVWCTVAGLPLRGLWRDPPLWSEEAGRCLQVYWSRFGCTHSSGLGFQDTIHSRTL